MKDPIKAWAEALRADLRNPESVAEHERALRVLVRYGYLAFARDGRAIVTNPKDGAIVGLARPPRT